MTSGKKRVPPETFAAFAECIPKRLFAPAPTTPVEDGDIMIGPLSKKEKFYYTLSVLAKQEQETELSIAFRELLTRSLAERYPKAISRYGRFGALREGYLFVMTHPGPTGHA